MISKKSQCCRKCNIGQPAKLLPSVLAKPAVAKVGHGNPITRFEGNWGISLTCRENIQFVYSGKSKKPMDLRRATPEHIGQPERVTQNFKSYLGITSKKGKN